MLATAARFSEGTPRQTQSWLRDLEQSPIFCYTERSSTAPHRLSSRKAIVATIRDIAPTADRDGLASRCSGVALRRGRANADRTREPQECWRIHVAMVRPNPPKRAPRQSPICRRPTVKEMPALTCAACAESLALKIPIEPESRRNAGEFTLRRYEGRARKAAQQGLTSAGGGRAWRRP